MTTFRLGQSKIVDVLLENGANVNLANNNGETALMIAAESGFTEQDQEIIVEILLEYEANIDLINKNGDTASSIAHKNGIVKKLDFLKKNIEFRENQQHCLFSDRKNIEYLIKHGKRSQKHLIRSHNH